jgi:hypothetical protein
VFLPAFAGPNPDGARQHWVTRGGAAGLAAGAPRTDTTVSVRLPGTVTVLRRPSPPVAARRRWWPC